MTDSGHYRWHELGEPDLDAIVALHNRVLEELPDPALVRPESPAFFTDILVGGGRMIGVFDKTRPLPRGGSGEGELVAYGVFQWGLEPGDDPRPTLGLPPTIPVGKLAGAVVAAGHRGCGLQAALIRRRVELGRTLGLHHLYSTSAPANWPSWSNLVEQDFRVVALQVKYGGLLRFLLYRCPESESDPVMEEPEPCDPRDTERLRALLAAGRCGVGVRRRADGRRLLLLSPTRSG